MILLIEFPMYKIISFLQRPIANGWTKTYKRDLVFAPGDCSLYTAFIIHYMFHILELGPITLDDIKLIPVESLNENEEMLTKFKKIAVNLDCKISQC